MVWLSDHRCGSSGIFWGTRIYKVLHTRGLLSMKRLRSIATPPGWDACPLKVTSQYFVRFPWQFAGTHLYSWVERGTVRVKCFAQEHNTMTRPGLEPGPLDPESIALTTRPPRLPLSRVILSLRPSPMDLRQWISVILPWVSQIPDISN